MLVTRDITRPRSDSDISSSMNDGNCDIRKGRTKISDGYDCDCSSSRNGDNNNSGSGSSSSSGSSIISRSISDLRCSSSSSGIGDSSRGKIRKGDLNLGFGDLSVLGESVLNNCVLPFLDFQDLTCLVITSSKFRKLIISTGCPVWMVRPMCICIDSSCFGCGRNQIKTSLAYRLFEFTNLNHLRLHTPTRLLGECLEYLCKAQKLNRLHLRLRNDDFGINVLSRTPLAQILKSKSNDDFLEAIIDTKNTCELNTVKDLVVYNCDSDHLAEKILSVVGRNLKQLSFFESSPSHLFSMLNTACPHIEYLSVYGPQNKEEVLSYNNSALVELRLENAGFIGFPRSCFPKMRSFASVDSSNQTFQDIRNVILSVPSSIVELELSINSKYINEILELMGTGVMSKLEHLHLHFLDEEDPAQDITPDAVYKLHTGCPSLVTAQFTDGLVGFAPEAFALFWKFTKLRKIVSLYDKPAVDSLKVLLKNSNSIEQIIFFECASYHGKAVWEQMNEELETVASSCNPSVQISLIDWWWN